MRIPKRIKILFISIAAPLLFVVAFVVVIAVYSTFHKTAEVTVTASGFAPQQIEIVEGETIHFANQSSTITQTLCLGSDTHCDRSYLLSLKLPPLVLLQSPGLRLAPDQAKDVVFNNAGTFTVTSTVVPRTNLTVTVDAGAD